MIDALKKLFRSAEAPPTREPSPAIVESDNAIALRRYAGLCSAAGVDRLYLVLTFDCDTDPDIDLAFDLDTDLRRRGIRAGYAVPGVQLEKGAATWRTLADNGAEFLNHGARAHAEWRDGRYWPVTFYHEWKEREVVDDITAGHQIVSDVIGARPEGFRAPHFGSYQEPEQLAVLYRTLRPFGYRYCSTTIPQLALTRGPLIDMGGIVELPTMGSYRNPTTLLDSWTYLTDRTRYTLSDEYFELFNETVTRMSEERLPGVLTYYADPSHVVDQKPFERALDVIAKHHVPSLQGREAVRKFRAL